MNETLKKGLLVLGIFLIGTAVGRFSLPAKIVEKEKIVFQDKIIEKKVEVKDIQKKNNKIYIKIEKTSPDGTKTVETRIIDKDETSSNTNTSDDKSQDTTQISDASKETIYATKDWLLSAAVNYSTSSSTMNYGVIAQRRILGPVYVGVYGFSDGTFGGSCGLSF